MAAPAPGAPGEVPHLLCPTACPPWPGTRRANGEQGRADPSVPGAPGHLHPQPTGAHRAGDARSPVGLGTGREQCRTRGHTRGQDGAQDPAARGEPQDSAAHQYLAQLDPPHPPAYQELAWGWQSPRWLAGSPLCPGMPAWPEAPRLSPAAIPCTPGDAPWHVTLWHITPWHVVPWHITPWHVTPLSHSSLSWQRHRSPPAMQWLQEEGEGGRQGRGRVADTSQCRGGERFARREPWGCPGTHLGSSRGSVSHPAAQGWELGAGGWEVGTTAKFVPIPADAGMLLGALSLIPMPALCQGRHRPLPVLPSWAPAPPEPAKIPPPWPGEMENHGHSHRLALTGSLRGGSRHLQGRASPLACPAPNHGAIPPGLGCHRACPRVTVPTVPGGGWKRSRHFLRQPLRALTVISKIRSHMWLAGEVAPWGPGSLVSPRWGPVAGGTGTEQPPGPPSRAGTAAVPVPVGAVPARPGRGRELISAPIRQSSQQWRFLLYFLPPLW